MLPVVLNPPPNTIHSHRCCGVPHFPGYFSAMITNLPMNYSIELEVGSDCTSSGRFYFYQSFAPKLTLFGRLGLSHRQSQSTQLLLHVVWVVWPITRHSHFKLMWSNTASKNFRIWNGLLNCMYILDLFLFLFYPRDITKKTVNKN